MIEDKDEKPSMGQNIASNTYININNNLHYYFYAGAFTWKRVNWQRNNDVKVISYKHYCFLLRFL